MIPFIVAVPGLIALALLTGLVYGVVLLGALMALGLNPRRLLAARRPTPSGQSPGAES